LGLEVFDLDSLGVACCRQACDRSGIAAADGYADASDKPTDSHPGSDSDEEKNVWFHDCILTASTHT
jgi:hypothetical protein